MQNIAPEKLVAHVRAYMREHRLKMPAFAEHCGIPRATLKPILLGQRQPREQVTIALVDGIMRPPPKKPDPPHADLVRRYWSCESSDAIGQRVGVSGARIRAIAKAIGLTEAAQSGSA